MKNKLMGALLATSMFVAVPVLADGEAAVQPAASSSTGWVSAACSTLLTPSEWHKGKAAWVSGAVTVAVVAAIAYNWGKADAEDNPTKDGDLI